MYLPEKVAALLTAGSNETNELTDQNTTCGNSVLSVIFGRGTWL